jgi:malate dehydrogenase (oxaloacetate-decarboxylating)
VTSDELNANYIIPSVFHADVHTAVASAVRSAAEASSRVATSDAARAHA